MKNQNYLQEKTFTIQAEGHQKPIHTFYNYRMTQLKSKVSFYEGQLDPLFNDNTSLRQSLNQLYKTVSISSDILRKLLPTHNHPNKKLELDLANLQQIAEMIAQEWQQLELTIKTQKQQIQILNNKISGIFNKCSEEILAKELQFQTRLNSQEIIKNGLIAKLQAFQKQRKITQHYKNKKINDLQVKVTSKQGQVQKLQRQLELLKYEAQEKCNTYQRKIGHLANQIQAKFKEIQEAKTAVRAICERVTDQKLAQQAQTYEYMLRSKEQQKMVLALSKEESQQFLNRKLQVKQLEYQKLSKLNECHRIQIDQLNNKVYSMNEQLARAKRINNELQAEIMKANSNNHSLTQQHRMRQQQINQQKRALEQTIANLNSCLHSLKEEHLKEVQGIVSRHKKLEAELLEKQLKLSEFQQIQNGFQKIWGRKIQKLKEQWAKHQQKLRMQIKERQAQLLSQQQAFNTAKYQYQKQILDVKEGNILMIENLERNYKKSTQNLIKQHNQALKKLKQEQQEQLVRDKLQYEKKFNMIKNQYQAEKNKIVLQLTRKFQEQKSTLLTQQLQLSTKIKNIEIQAELTRKKLLKAQNQIKEFDKQIEKINTQNYKKLKSLQQKNEQEKRKLNQRLQQQLKDFQKQLEEQISTMCNMKAQFQQEVSNLKDEKGVKTIQQNNRRQVDQSKAKFNEDLRQIQESYYQKFNDLKESHSKEIDQIRKTAQIQLQNLQNQHKNQIQILKLNFQKDLIVITEQTENKLTCINDRLLSGIHSDDLLKVDKIVLTSYLIKSVQRLKLQINDGDDKISALKLQLNKRQREIQAYEKNMQEKVKAKRQQYDSFKLKLQRQMENLQSNCKTELSKAQKEKLQYTQNMFEQFCVIKSQHQKKYENLLSKYKQLQKMFDNRPSRVEDVTKIKELISQKDKMNYQMQSYQKKVETANQIVRYLNIELQNYKLTYDIFGPNQNIIGPSFSPNKTISFKEQLSVTQPLKVNKLQKMKDQYRFLAKEVPLVRQQNDFPLINELKVFQQPDSLESQMLQPKGSQQGRKRKLSLISQKGQVKKQRIRTEKIGVQIITHADNFIKTINETKKDGFISLQEVEKTTNDSKRKTYRKRKFSKKIVTQGSQHYF